MHTLQLSLNTTSYDNHQIERRFHAVSHIHNVTVKHAIKLINQLKRDKIYCSCLSEYTSIKNKEKLSSADKKRLKALSKLMSDTRLSIGLSEYGLQSYIKVCAKQYTKLLSSQQVQKEATRVWRGVEKVLFGNGKKLHFKKYRDFDTICGKTNTNGAKFDKSSMTVDWLGLCLKCKPISKNDTYKTEALSHDISYCEIKRMMFNNGWHYYVVLYLKGNAPKKLVKIGHNKMGIDPGVSTMAGVSDDKAVLKELAPKSKDYDKQIQKLQQRMDASKRITNPDKYNQDGTINKSNQDKWVYSNTYKKNSRRLKCVYRKKSAYTKQSHEELANELLEDSSTFFVEDMNYAALAKKSKKPAERQDKTANIKQKDGTTKAVKKYKKKKRYGKSLNNRSPSLFLKILKRKCELYGGQMQTVNTRTFKASQYDHVKDEYIKVPLTQREKVVGGYTVQRDLYSAFLIKNADHTLKHADRDKCIYEFEHFVIIHNQLINNLKASNVTMKQCFGF